MYITLEEAKAHLEVDQDYTGDDQLITDIILDVEDIAAADLRVSLADMKCELGALPRSIRRAMLLLIGSYYKNRENEIQNSESAKMQCGYQDLIDLYKSHVK